MAKKDKDKYGIRVIHVGIKHPCLNIRQARWMVAECLRVLKPSPKENDVSNNRIAFLRDVVTPIVDKGNMPRGQTKLNLERIYNDMFAAGQHTHIPKEDK